MDFRRLGFVVMGSVLLASGAAAQTVSPHLALAATAAGPSHTGDDLLRLINSAPDGATIQLKGTYTAPVGTTYAVQRRLNVAGNGAILVNIRLLFLADMSLSDLMFLEQDCTFHVAAPNACSPAAPLLTIGYQGHAITSALVRNVSMNFTRAYTGIAFGLGPTSNVTIDGFSIVDNEMSAITALGGQHITIQNGTMVGGTQRNVDDGIALYAVYGELDDVTVQNVQAQNTFDLVGIGALMYYPIQRISVTHSACDRTAICLYIKSGDQSAVPAGYTGFSRLSHVRISGITDSDTAGTRHQSSIWIVGAGGAAADDLVIDQVTTRARASLTPASRVKLFSDGKSPLSGIVLSNLDMRDPSGTAKTGFAMTEAINIQDLGNHDISTVALTNVKMDGASLYGIDSASASVDSLSISDSTFTNMNLSSPGSPLFLIPYAYSLNGSMVLY